MRYHSIQFCRICQSSDLHILFDLGQLSSCGYFLNTKQENKAPAAPICLIRCQNCGLVQLQHNYDQDNLFRNTYGYRSGLNASMVQHLSALVQSIQKKIPLSSSDTVLDIGSNDATLLKSYSVPGLHRIGIDPSIEQFQAFYPADIERCSDFFTQANFKKIAPNTTAKVITSISMFYDLPDPNTFVADIAAILHNDGMWIFEQSYLPTMLKRNSFDTICHEHLEYYALKQIITLLKRHKLHVIDVLFNDINGGSFQVYACHESAPYSSDTSKIEKILKEEQIMGLDTLEPFENFWQRIEAIKHQLIQFLKKCQNEDKKVHGYGASTKGNTLLQHFNITPELISLIADCNDTKWGYCTPGTNIPIVSENDSRNQSPDYYLVLPWHFRNNFLQREKSFLDNGGQFIFPLPQFELVGKKV